MKRWERDLSKVEWYQENPLLKPIICPHDGSDMVGDASYGTVFLRCPACDYRVRQIPDSVYCEFYERVIMSE